MTADFFHENNCNIFQVHNSYISRLDKCLSPNCKFVEILMVSNNCVESFTKRKHLRVFWIYFWKNFDELETGILFYLHKRNFQNRSQT